MWTAIKAIELAGTDDPGKVAAALRSGNLEFDSAWGPLRVDADGKGKVSVMVAQVQEGANWSQCGPGILSKCPQADFVARRVE